MDLIYYQERINKVINEYLVSKKWNLFIKINYFIIFFILGLSVFAFIYKQYYLLFLWVIYVIALLSVYIGKSIKHNSYIQNKVYPLILDIINKETDNQLHKTNDLVSLIKQTRLVYKYDNVSVKYGFKFNINDVNGYYAYVHSYRTAGQTTYPVIIGEIFILQINNNKDFQIRNDNMGMYKGKKIKQKDNDYKLYCSKDIAPTNVDDEDFYNVQSLFKNVKHVGIDYQKKQIAIFINNKNPFKIKDVNKKTIEECYNNNIQTINNINKLINIFND